MRNQSTDGTETSVLLKEGQYRHYLAYKHSGVEWIGEVPEHWEVRRLKYVSPLRPTRLDEKPSDQTYIGLENIEPWTGRLLLQAQPEHVQGSVNQFEAGDVLFGKLRPYLAKVARPAFKGVCTGEVAVLRPERCSQSYLSYLLLNESYIRWIDAITYGTKMPRVSPDQVANGFAPLPPVQEQQAIGTFLDGAAAKIDALVVKKERLIELLQEKRTALITQAVTKGLDPDVRMKDSGVEWLGEIPEHWTIRPLKRLTNEITVGVVVNPSSYISDEGVPFIYGSDVREGNIAADTARKMSKEHSEWLRKSRLCAGDLVTVHVGAPGLTAVIPPELEGANCASVIVVRRAKSFCSGWLCYVMNSRVMRYQIELVQYGAAQEQFNVAHAVEFFAPEPPLDDQRILATLLDREATKIDALVAKVREAIGRLKELRTALISAAVTGKIDVRHDADPSPRPLP